MAALALEGARDVVSRLRPGRVIVFHAVTSGQYRFSLVGTPEISRVLPLFGGRLFDIAGLDALPPGAVGRLERKFLPEARTDRKIPEIGCRVPVGLDFLTGRNEDPTLLTGAVAPQRVLR